MPSFLDIVETCFGTKDLYEVLGVKKKATNGDIRRAYHKLSLKVHPDRVESGDVEEATKKFQTLGKVYSVLTDKDKRSIYDEDGTVDEEDDTIFKQDRDWCEYWRLLFPKITVEDIKNFEDSYKGSEEERDAVKSIYLEKEGDMDALLENIMCASIEDESRFREMIEGWIHEGDVPPFPAFVKETKARKRARAKKWKGEAEEAAKAQQEKGTEAASSSLTALIKARQQTREQKMGNFFDSLEEKYSKSTKKPKVAKAQGQSSGSKRSKRKGGKTS